MCRNITQFWMVRCGNWTIIKSTDKLYACVAHSMRNRITNWCRTFVGTMKSMRESEKESKINHIYADFFSIFQAYRLVKLRYILQHNIKRLAYHFMIIANRDQDRFLIPELILSLTMQMVINFQSIFVLCWILNTSWSIYQQNKVCDYSINVCIPKRSMMLRAFWYTFKLNGNGCNLNFSFSLPYLAKRAIVGRSHVKSHKVK